MVLLGDKVSATRITVMFAVRVVVGVVVMVGVGLGL